MSSKPIALVTGGAQGIGAACGKALAADGYHVVLADVQDSVMDTAAALGGTGMICDMSDADAILALFDTIEADLGPVSALVNNAGVLDQEGSLEDFSAERISRIVDLNVTGALICAREAVRRRSTNNGGKGGSIVNISSMAATLGSGGTYVDYAASKGAIDSFTIGLSREVARQGIRVNGIRPGIIETDIHASGGNPTRANDLADTVPMGRAGKPQEIAEAVIWLASDKASYVTGSTINVSGGR